MSYIERNKFGLMENRAGLDRSLRYVLFGDADAQVAVLTGTVDQARAALANRDPFPGLSTQPIWAAQRVGTDGFGEAPSLDAGINVPTDDIVFEPVDVKPKVSYPINVATMAVVAVNHGLVERPWNLGGQQSQDKESLPDIIGKTMALLYTQAIRASVKTPSEYFSSSAAADVIASGLIQALEITAMTHDQRREPETAGNFRDTARYLRVTRGVELDSDGGSLRTSIDLARSLLWAINSVEISLAVMRQLGCGEEVSVNQYPLIRGLQFNFGEQWQRVTQSGALTTLPPLSEVLAGIKSGKDLKPLGDIYWSDAFMGVKGIFDRSLSGLGYNATRLLAAIYAQRIQSECVTQRDIFDILRTVSAVREVFVEDLICDGKQL